MGRLIDADANREDFKKIVCRTLADYGTTSKEQFNVIMTAFDSMPTAYSVEKVVEELEEEREYSYADFEEYVQEKSPCLDAEYDDYFHRGLERAIKLVKRGGVE